MALTNRGKELAMSVGIASATRYISCHLSSGNELAGHGYARKAITNAQMTVAATGVITLPVNLPLWTASDGSAQNPDQWAVYDALTGGAQVFEPQDFTTDVAAPGNGQAVRLTGVLNP